jgi:hypothetical protein
MRKGDYMLVASTKDTIPRTHHMSDIDVPFAKDFSVNKVRFTQPSSQTHHCCIHIEESHFLVDHTTWQFHEFVH